MDHSQNAAASFNRHAELYQSKFMDVSAYAEGLDLFIESIKNKSGSVLEIGCGPGNILKYISNKAPQFKLSGIDLASEMIRLAEINCPAAKLEIMDCRNLESISEQFDGIIISFCLPYLNQQETSELISTAAEKLNSDGVIYISTIKGNYDNSGIRLSSKGEEVYMHYYQPSDLYPLLNANNLKIMYEAECIDKNDPHQETNFVLVAMKT